MRWTQEGDENAFLALLYIVMVCKIAMTMDGRRKKIRTAAEGAAVAAAERQQSSS